MAAGVPTSYYDGAKLVQEVFYPPWSRLSTKKMLVLKVVMRVCR